MLIDCSLLPPMVACRKSLQECLEMRSAIFQPQTWPTLSSSKQHRIAFRSFWSPKSVWMSFCTKGPEFASQSQSTFTTKLQTPARSACLSHDYWCWSGVLLLCALAWILSWASISQNQFRCTDTHALTRCSPTCWYMLASNEIFKNWTICSIWLVLHLPCAVWGRAVVSCLHKSLQECIECAALSSHLAWKWDLERTSVSYQRHWDQERSARARTKLHASNADPTRQVEGQVCLLIPFTSYYITAALDSCRLGLQRSTVASPKRLFIWWRSKLSKVIHPLCVFMILVGWCQVFQENPTLFDMTVDEELEASGLVSLLLLSWITASLCPEAASGQRGRGEAQKCKPLRKPRAASKLPPPEKEGS